MAEPISVPPPPNSTPEVVWTTEVVQRLVQRIYELEEKIEEMANVIGNS